MKNARFVRHRVIQATFVGGILLGSAFGDIVYENDFSTRISAAVGLSSAWQSTSYVKGNLSVSSDATKGRANCLSAITGSTSMQDGWYWAYDGNTTGESQFYRLVSEGQANKCATFLNSNSTVSDTSRDHRTFVFQSFQNEFTNGILRISFDLRAFAFPTVANNNLLVGPIYRKYLDFWWTASLPKYAGLAGINIANQDVNDMRVYSYGGNGLGGSVYDGGYGATKLTRGDWYRYVVDFNADAMTMSGRVYAMGSTQPELDSVGTLMGDLHTAHFYADMTVETGGFAGIVIRDCGSVSSPNNTYTESRAPMIDNIRCWWRSDGTDFTEKDLFYENDFVTRRSRTIQPEPQTVASYDLTEKTVTTTFSKYYYYTTILASTDQMKNRLVMSPTGTKVVQSVSFDGMRLLNGQSTLSFFAYNPDNNPRMLGLRLNGSTSPFGIFAQHLGESITTGKVRLSYDARTPKSWIANPNIYGMLAPQNYYDSKDDDIQTTAYAFRAGLQGTQNSTATKFIAIGSTTETSADAKTCNWYRIVATCDLSSKTFDAQIYDIGTTPIAMTAATLGEPVFAKTNISLKNQAITDISCFALFLGGTPDITSDGAIHIDNIQVWKQPSGAADWTPIYSNDFTTRTRYNVKETSCRLTELNDVMGTDGWVMRANGTSPIAASGGTNPSLRYDGNDTGAGGFSWVVQPIGRSIRRHKARFRVDIKPPRVWTPGYAADTGVLVGIGDEQMYSGSRAGGDSTLNFLNHYQVRFGIAPKASGATDTNYEINKYRNNKACYFDQNGTRTYPVDANGQEYAFDWTHWYRFEASVDADTQTYDLSVYDMGATPPERTTKTETGALVFTREQKQFRMPFTDGRGLSALTVCFEGCVKDSPWNEYDDGQAYVDNIVVEYEKPGFSIIVR